MTGAAEGGVANESIIKRAFDMLTHVFHQRQGQHPWIRQRASYVLEVA